MIVFLVTLMLGMLAIIVRTGGVLEAYLALAEAAIMLVFLTVFMINTARLRDKLENCYTLLEHNDSNGTGRD